MTKRIDWDQVSRLQKGQRHGIETAYDELPPVGSWADQQRVATRKKPNQNAKPLAPRTKIAPMKKVGPKPLARCPLCGNLVGKMKRHLQKAHGAIPGHEHEAPPSTPSNEEVTP
jgi:hypothetical protein